MVISRESPRAKVSPDKNTASWPPKSPYEALLSSPSGRKKWDEHRATSHARDPSPSPRGKSVTTSTALRNLAMSDDEEEADEDEDEETLRLQLQAIEARLKLKKLQKKKQQTTGVDQSDDAPAPTSGRSYAVSPRKTSKTSSHLSGVQVPVSPIKDRMPPPDPPKVHTSPARVLLGIDKGLKAKDVSLKRARNGTQLPRQNSTGATPSAIQSTPKPSFSERIAASRLSNEEQEAKEERIRQARSKTFSTQPSSSSTPSAASSRSVNPVFRRPPTSSVDIASDPQSPFISNNTRRSTPASSLSVSDRYSHIDGDSEGKSTEPSEDGSSFECYSSLHLSRRKTPHTDLVRSVDGKEIYPLPRLLKEVKAPHYDPPDCESDFVVFAIIASKSSPYTTKAKHQVNSSTEPDLHEEANPRNKFMVMTLTDLKWEIDLFLFDTAFTQFWKMTPGTLIAILNPSVMPPKTNQHSGRFSLKLASSEDSVIEIGTARDLDFCKSIKKDGKECGSWVNKRRSHFCDFHVELAVEKTRKSRMEVNAMYRPNNLATGSNNNNKAFKPYNRNPQNGTSHKPSNLSRDHDSGTQFFMGGKGTSFSAATLLDAEDMGKADNMRRRLKEKEKERILAEKLGRLGNGMGAEYLRTTTEESYKRDTQRNAPSTSASTTASTSTANNPPKPRPARDDTTYNPTGALDPAALDILARTKKAADVDLRSVNGRKRAFHASATSSAGTEALGWGGANKWGLLMPPRAPNDRAKSPEKGQLKLRFEGEGQRKEREDSPRKRARFEIDGKGLREPGRESLGDIGVRVGVEVGKKQAKRDAKGRIVVEVQPDSSDDDLDIF